MHCLLAALADLALFAFVNKNYGSNLAYKVAFCRKISWLNSYMSTRSLTNNVEEILTIFCLYSIERNPGKNTNFMLFHFFAFLSFVIRSTAAINLIPIYFYNFFFLCKSSKFKFIYQFVLVG